mmetsp:Transcript_31162/g.80017  ORF Transcript_31162/g.80017 Transcript_31162/m.80017 type:complete len:275 (-) Transcript_31162:508-1332(-)
MRSFSIWRRLLARFFDERCCRERHLPRRHPVLCIRSLSKDLRAQLVAARQPLACAQRGAVGGGDEAAELQRALRRHAGDQAIDEAAVEGVARARGVKHRLLVNDGRRGHRHHGRHSFDDCVLALEGRTAHVALVVAAVRVVARRAPRRLDGGLLGGLGVAEAALQAEAHGARAGHLHAGADGHVPAADGVHRRAPLPQRQLLANLLKRILQVVLQHHLWQLPALANGPIARRQHDRPACAQRRHQEAHAGQTGQHSNHRVADVLLACPVVREVG